MYILSGNDLMVIIDDVFYKVENRRLKKDSKIKTKGSNLAFPIGDYVYPYRGRIKDGDTLVGLYKSDDGLVVLEPETDAEKEKYSIKHVISLDTKSIFDHIEKDTERFIQLEDIEIINNNTDIFVPLIKEEDDFLKYVIKRVIIEKQINLKNYRDKFKNEYSLNNMKSSLNKSTKMTIPNFNAWSEVLGFRWEMKISDDGTDPNRPLQTDIEISSEDF